MHVGSCIYLGLDGNASPNDVVEFRVEEEEQVQELGVALQALVHLVEVETPESPNVGLAAAKYGRGEFMG